MRPDEAYKLSQTNPLEFKIKKDYYESILASDIYYSYFYARVVLKDRFELGEKTILMDCWYSYLYAMVVLKDRFESGEYSISRTKLFFKNI